MSWYKAQNPDRKTITHMLNVLLPLFRTYAYVGTTCTSVCPACPPVLVFRSSLNYFAHFLRRVCVVSTAALYMLYCTIRHFNTALNCPRRNVRALKEEFLSKQHKKYSGDLFPGRQTTDRLFIHASSANNFRFFFFFFPV